MACLSQAEAVASSMLDFPEIIFVQKRKDDEDDLERLEKGLKVWPFP